MDPAGRQRRRGRGLPEADDLDATFKTVATSDEPFDRWFRDHVRRVHGIALEDGFAPPEPILDFRTES